MYVAPEQDYDEHDGGDERDQAHDDRTVERVDSETLTEREHERVSGRPGADRAAVEVGIAVTVGDAARARDVHDGVRSQADSVPGVGDEHADDRPR